MVRIINGEIVQDDDPRLFGRKKPATTASSSQSNPTARIASLLGGQGGSSGGSGGVQGGPPAAAYGPRSPLDYLAGILHIENRTVSIPAIPQLKLTASSIPLVYFIPVGFILMMFGWRGVFFVLAFYGLQKHSESNHNLPPTPPP